VAGHALAVPELVPTNKFGEDLVEMLCVAAERGRHCLYLLNVVLYNYLPAEGGRIPRLREFLEWGLVPEARHQGILLI